MRGHLQCRDTLAGNEGCPLKTGTTVAGGLSDLAWRLDTSGGCRNHVRIYYGKWGDDSSVTKYQS